MRHHSRINTFIISMICLGWLLTACGTVISTTQPSVTPSPTQLPTSTVTPTITPTSTPQPPLAVLWAAKGADQALVGSLQTSLNDIVIQAGLRWQVRQQLSVSDLTPELRLVVVVPPDAGLAELVAAAPGTQFLAIGIPGLDPAANLTTIGAEASRTDQQGFIAGYIAAMLSDDWRVGVISISDTLEGRAARTGFLNGVEYFCGLCRSIHPPFYEYPLYVELTSTATTIEWQELANYMADHYVETVYVYHGAGDEAMLSMLAQSGINIIGSGTPPQSAGSSWLVSIGSDPSPLIQSEVKGLLDGSLAGGQVLAGPIQLTNINTSQLTPGKLRLVEQVISDIQSGYIDTGVDMTSGENRP